MADRKAKAPAEVPRTITIALDFPVEFKDESYSELTFRRLKGRDMATSDAFRSRIEKHMAMLAGMAGVPVQVIFELDADDYERVSEETIPLMGKSTAAAHKAAQEAAAKAMKDALDAAIKEASGNRTSH